MVWLLYSRRFLIFLNGLKASQVCAIGTLSRCENSPSSLVAGCPRAIRLLVVRFFPRSVPAWIFRAVEAPSGHGFLQRDLQVVLLEPQSRVSEVFFGGRDQFHGGRIILH